MFIAALVVLVVSLGWGVSSPFDGDVSGPDVTEETDADPKLDDTEPSEKASGGGKLKIVESGYGLTTDGGDDDDLEMVSWGAIVENTSDREVANSSVRVEARDDDEEENSGGDYNAQIIELKPGERVGVGGTDYLDGADFKDAKFHLGDTTWEKDSSSIGAVTVDKVSTKRDAKKRLRVTARFKSSHAVLIERALAIAVYRDADGKIVGASRYDNLETGGDFPPGWCVRNIEVEYGPPESAVDKKVEVYAQGSNTS